MKLVLGFSGKARHGKTEACTAVKRYCDGVSTLCKVYEFSAVILDWCIAQGRLPVGSKRVDLNPGQLAVLVAAGNEGRRIHRDFWVGQILEAMRSDDPEVALTPNIRFSHEVDMLHQLQGATGYVLRCTRLNENGSVYISPDRDPNDVTETSLDYFPVDFYLTAKNGHAELMARQAVTLYKYIAGGIEGL